LNEEIPYRDGAGVWNEVMYFKLIFFNYCGCYTSLLPLHVTPARDHKKAPRSHPGRSQSITTLINFILLYGHYVSFGKMVFHLIFSILLF